MSTPRLIGLLILIAALTFGVGFAVLFMSGPDHFREPRVKLQAPQEIVQALRAGDYAKAISESQAVLNDPQSGANEKAIAVFNSLGAEYRAQGDTQAILSDIRSMKEIILNETLTRWVRANTLDVLVKQYYITGRDPSVLAEIYKGEPFSSYYVSEDPDLSARKLAEWAYSLRPTSNSAITIARWYTEQRVLNPDQPVSLTREYATAAEEHLKKADAAAIEEAQTDATYPDSRRYLYYRYWRTIVVSRLALQKGEPYASRYQDEFEQFITFTQTIDNALSKEFRQYAHLSYAQRLVRDGDKDAAKTQLDLLAGEISATGDSEVNAFVQYLRNEHKYRPSGINWKSVLGMSEISPAFKAAVEGVVGAF